MEAETGVIQTSQGMLGTTRTLKNQGWILPYSFLRVHGPAKTICGSLASDLWENKFLLLLEALTVFDP